MRKKKRPQREEVVDPDRRGNNDGAPQYELKFVRWDSLEMLQALHLKIKWAADAWTDVVQSAPGRSDAKRIMAVARTLNAIDLALEFGDEDLIRKLEDTARAFLRGYEMDLDRHTASDQKSNLAKRVGDMIARGAGQDVRGLAEVILIELDQGAIGRKLAQAGITLSTPRPGTRARRDLNPDAIRRVEIAIARELDPERAREPGVDVGERVVSKALEALGLGRGAFSYKEKRVMRNERDDDAPDADVIPLRKADT